jgi:hypothetical protein
VAAQHRPYLDRVKKAQKERQETAMKPFSYPTPAELYALEQSARRERAREQVRLVRIAIAAVKSFAAQALSMRAPSAHEVHRQVARHA